MTGSARGIGGRAGGSRATFLLRFVPLWKLFGHYSVISANFHRLAAGAGSGRCRSGGHALQLPQCCRAQGQPRCPDQATPMRP